MTLAEQVLNLLEERNPFPWEMTREEFENHWNYGKGYFSLPTPWLRDPSFVTGHGKSGNVSIRDREGSSRSPEYLRELEASIGKEGIKMPVSLNLTRDGDVIIFDGTHRVMIAADLDHTFVPIEFTPNFLDYNGYELVVKKAFEEGRRIPMEVLAQFDWAR